MLLRPRSRNWLDRTWVETANAVDCNYRLEAELAQAKELTRSCRQALREEKAKQENLKKLIQRQKNETNSKDDGTNRSGEEPRENS